MLDVGLVLENPTDGVDAEGHDEVLDGDGHIRDDVGVISEIVGSIGHQVDKVHPLELVGGEESHRGSEQPSQSVFHALIYRLFAIRVFDHGTVQDRVGRRYSEGGDHTCDYVLQLVETLGAIGAHAIFVVVKIKSYLI